MLRGLVFNTALKKWKEIVHRGQCVESEELIGHKSIEKTLTFVVIY